VAEVSRVFVVQNQQRRDPASGRLVPKFDLEPAREHGELVFLLGGSAKPFRPEPVLRQLREQLADFSDADSLLLIGNPCLIGWATAIAADANEGRVRLLQWSGSEGRYVAICAEDVFGDSDQPSDAAV
jgi:hypothetical protein